MTPTTLVLGLAFLAMVIVILRRARSGRPSIGLSLLAAVCLVLGSLGAWVAWVEPPGSHPSTLVYGALALWGGITLFRQITAVLSPPAE